MKAIDLTGKRFNMLTVQKFSHKDEKTNSLFWLCVCECGNLTTARSAVLKNGHKTNCGCIRKVKCSKFFKTDPRIILQRKIPTHVIHGLDRTSAEYRAWIEMKRRCRKPHKGEYHLWQGRGIKVCDRWLNSYANFLSDMGIKPSPKHSLDRIDNYGNYEPSNCRWATPKEQISNRRPRSEWI